MDDSSTPPLVVKFGQVGRYDVEQVGGKNASLGEMFQHLSAAGVPVPDGFAVTASAYRDVLALNGLDRVNKLAALFGQPESLATFALVNDVIAQTVKSGVVTRSIV
jgi:phosphoenolpyruvate synthase/pyruvate phosphate dikinase